MPEPSVSTTTTTPSLEVGEEEFRANSSGAAGVAPSSNAESLRGSVIVAIGGPRRAHRMSRIELIVAWIFKLVRPRLIGVRVSLTSFAAQPSAIEAGKLDQRIAFSEAIDSGKRSSGPLQRRIRLDPFGIRCERVFVAPSRCEPAQSAAARHLRPQRAGAARRGSSGRAPRSASQLTASEGAHELGRLLLSFRGDREKRRESHAPWRGDRKSPSEPRTTHTRSKHPCLEFTSPRCGFMKSAQCEPFPLSALKVAGTLTKGEGGTSRFGARRLRSLRGTAKRGSRCRPRGMAAAEVA